MLTIHQLPRFGMAAAAATFGLVMLTPAPAFSEVSVVYATHVGTGATSNRQYEAYLEELSERTDGYITVGDKFHNEALIRAVDMLRNVGRGLADVGYFCTGYTPALLPLTSMMELPYVTDKGDAWARAAMELYETNDAFQAEFHALNLELLALDAPSPTIIGANREVNSAEDLSGLRLRAYGDLGAIVEQGGNATPVPLSTADIFTSMQTGVIDGYVGIPLWMPYPENWLPLTKSLVNPGIGVYYACGLVMNRDVYEGLPDEVKQVISEMRQEFPEKSIQYVIEGDEASINAAVEQGVTFYRFTPEEVEAWKEGVDYDAMRAEWIEIRSERTNADVEEFLELFQATLAKYEPESVYTQDFPTE